jgi:hypothetical protein
VKLPLAAIGNWAPSLLASNNSIANHTQHRPAAGVRGSTTKVLHDSDTAYGLASASAVAKAKLVTPALSFNLLPPFGCKAIESVSPETAP